jgi:hypothetical protein
MMSEPTPGVHALNIPAQDTGRDIEPGGDFGRDLSRDLASVIHQSIHPDATGTARPRHRAEPAALEPPPAHQPSPSPKALVPHVYETPVWVPTQGTPQQTRPSHELIEADPIDSGADAALLDPEWTQVARREDLLRHARWRAPHHSRIAVAMLLAAAVAASVVIGTGLLEQQSTPTLGLALSCLLAASGLYAILVATTPTVVTLDEVTLTVRHRGRTDSFDLTHPYEDVQVSGKPGTAKWVMRLGCPDGHTIVVNGRMVDSRRLAPAVAYAQEYAQRGRDAREERFNR